MKTITVPKSHEAAKRLDFDESNEGDLLEVNLDQQSFDLLFESGLIESLNSKLNLMIDDFEDESISEPDQIIQGLAIVEEYAKQADSPVLNIIQQLFKASLMYKTGVYFFF